MNIMKDNSTIQKTSRNQNKSKSLSTPSISLQAALSEQREFPKVAQIVTAPKSIGIDNNRVTSYDLLSLFCITE